MNLGGGILDLNGHTLTVTGDFIQTGGSVSINGGELIIAGDAKINKIYWTKTQNSEDSEDATKNIKGGKDLYIENGNFDLKGYKLKVKGNVFQTNGSINVNGGKIEMRRKYNSI